MIVCAAQPAMLETDLVPVGFLSSQFSIRVILSSCRDRSRRRSQTQSDPLRIDEFQNSVALVYGEFGNGNSIQIPYVSKFYNFNANFLYSGTGTSDCTMRITKTAGAVSSSIRFIKVRVLVIPAASFEDMSSIVDVSDLAQVREFFRL